MTFWNMTFDVKHPVPLPSHLSLSLLLDITQTLCISLSPKLNPNFALTLKTSSRILFVWVFTEDRLICCISGGQSVDLFDALTGYGRMVINLGGTASLMPLQLRSSCLSYTWSHKLSSSSAECKVDETLYPLIKASFSTLLCSVLSITLDIC